MLMLTRIPMLKLAPALSRRPRGARHLTSAAALASARLGPENGVCVLVLVRVRVRVRVRRASDHVLVPVGNAIGSGGGTNFGAGAVIPTPTPSATPSGRALLRSASAPHHHRMAWHGIDGSSCGARPCSAWLGSAPGRFPAWPLPALTKTSTNAPSAKKGSCSLPESNR